MPSPGGFSNRLLRLDPEEALRAVLGFYDDRIAGVTPGRAERARLLQGAARTGDGHRPAAAFHQLNTVNFPPRRRKVARGVVIIVGHEPDTDRVASLNSG